jgi:hypothetical protein
MEIRGYITEEEMARRCGRTVRTLRMWRRRRQGPAWTKMGKTVAYAEDSGQRYLKSQEQQPVRQ